MTEARVSMVLGSGLTKEEQETLDRVESSLWRTRLGRNVRLCEGSGNGINRTIRFLEIGGTAQVTLSADEFLSINAEQLLDRFE